MLHTQYRQLICNVTVVSISLHLARVDNCAFDFPCMKLNSVEEEPCHSTLNTSMSNYVDIDMVIIFIFIACVRKNNLIRHSIPLSIEMYLHEVSSLLAWIQY